MQEQQKHIQNYLKAVSKLYGTGITAEHSFRGDLCTLLENLTDYQVINEAKHINCGAPDLTLLNKNRIPVAYIEAKDIGKNLNDRNYKEQFTRYKKALDNLIITDYLTFQYFRGETLVTETVIGKEQDGRIVPLPENFNKFIEIIRDFSAYNGKAIKNSKELAEFMAAKAKLLEEVIDKMDFSNSSLNNQLEGFKQVLIPTLTQAQFADMYAQTVAYGMFIARLQYSPSLAERGQGGEVFSRSKASALIPRSNPFLRNLFHYIAGIDIDENIEWIVDSIADMFNYVDINDIRTEFESKNKDPFIHFYEDFLTKYSKTTRDLRGAYYTPIEVVDFIVRGVDDVLKTEFGIPDGLADNSTVETRHATSLPEQIHKIQILDPATGTGTFLAQVVRQIGKSFGTQSGDWSDYVKEHLIPRLNGFEIMMSPYTMAHLKIELLLQELGATDINNRLNIFLTDSLEKAKTGTPKIPFAQWLSNEAQEADKVKNDKPVMVVLGNPPYNVKSQNKGQWMESLVADYKKNLNERNIQPLSDDYIKFIRFGQYFIEKNGEGILAYISNNSFLDGLIHRQMRKKLLETFDKIYILDLHGNSLKKETTPDGEKDENVFDIQQGVSINIFVKTGE